MSTTISASASLRGTPRVIERFVSLPATSGTTIGPTVAANSLVLAAGVELLTTVPNITTYTANITDGTTTFASAVALNNTAAGTIRVGTTAGFVPVQDTIDAVTTITGAPGVINARIWALVVNVNDSVRQGASATRDARS